MRGLMLSSGRVGWFVPPFAAKGFGCLILSSTEPPLVPHM